MKDEEDKYDYFARKVKIYDSWRSTLAENIMQEIHDFAMSTPFAPSLDDFIPSDTSPESFHTPSHPIKKIGIPLPQQTTKQHSQVSVRGGAEKARELALDKVRQCLDMGKDARRRFDEHNDKSHKFKTWRRLFMENMKDRPKEDTDAEFLSMWLMEQRRLGQEIDVAEKAYIEAEREQFRLTPGNHPDQVSGFKDMPEDRWTAEDDKAILQRFNPKPVDKWLDLVTDVESIPDIGQQIGSEHPFPADLQPLEFGADVTEYLRDKKRRRKIAVWTKKTRRQWALTCSQYPQLINEELRLATEDREEVRQQQNSEIIQRTVEQDISAPPDVSKVAGHVPKSDSELAPPQPTLAAAEQHTSPPSRVSTNSTPIISDSAPEQVSGSDPKLAPSQPTLAAAEPHISPPARVLTRSTPIPSQSASEQVSSSDPKLAPSQPTLAAAPGEEQSGPRLRPRKRQIDYSETRKTKKQMTESAYDRLKSADRAHLKRKAEGQSNVEGPGGDETSPPAPKRQRKQ